MALQRAVDEELIKLGFNELAAIKDLVADSRMMAEDAMTLVDSLESSFRLFDKLHVAFPDACKCATLLQKTRTALPEWTKMHDEHYSYNELVAALFTRTGHNPWLRQLRAQSDLISMRQAPSESHESIIRRFEDTLEIAWPNGADTSFVFSLFANALNKQGAMNQEIASQALVAIYMQWCADFPALKESVMTNVRAYREVYGDWHRDDVRPNDAYEALPPRSCPT